MKEANILENLFLDQNNNCHMANPRAGQLDLAVATPQLSKLALCIYGSVGFPIPGKRIYGLRAGWFLAPL